MIPSGKLDQVKKALEITFGLSICQHIQQLTKGLSGSPVYKITVHGVPYLLRIVKTDSRDNPARYFGGMQTAADAGIAPKILYLSPEDGISITHFIEEQPFKMPVARDKMADLIRRLHSLPKFPSQLDYVDAADGFIQKFRTSPIAVEKDLDIIYESYRRISKVYPRSDRENLVSSHNDIKPDNIIFDGAKPWLVDWEAARLNDRYLDLAACANFVVNNVQDEAEFLRTYFGKEADAYQQARFYLMSNIVHLFCFSLCAMMVSGGKTINIKASHPGFTAFHDGLWLGEISLANKEEKLQYALVHLDEFQHKIHNKRFDESLRIVAEHNNHDKQVNHLVN